MDITRFDALAYEAKRIGLAKTIPSMLEIIEDHYESLFKRMQKVMLSTNCSGLGYTITGSRSTGHCRSFPTCHTCHLKTAGVLPAPVVALHNRCREHSSSL